MQKTFIFKRVLSLLLAAILLLELTPSFSAPVFAAENGMPQTAKFIHTKFGIDGHTSPSTTGSYYTSPHLGSKVYVQNFVMSAGGKNISGFCNDHTLWLNNEDRCYNTTFNYTGKITAEDLSNHPYLPFLDYYYWEVDNGVDDQTLAIHRMYAQSAIWLTGKGFTNPDDEASLQLILDEREAYYKSLGQSSEVPGYSGMKTLKDIVKTWKGEVAGADVPHRNYYIYTPDDKGIQPIIIPELNPVDKDHEAYIRLEKTDGEGAPLGDCDFKVYSDSSCMDEVATFTSGSDGNAVAEVKWEGTETTKTFWVVETSAKDGYVKADGAHPVTVNSQTNGTEATAAVVEGSPFKNTIIPPESILRKVNQHGEGIGPATFKFEGSGADGKYFSGEFTTDEAGILALQWWAPDKEDYIQPGEYTVTETVAPPGCELSTEAKHITLSIREDGTPEHSGPLVFTNNQRPSVVIEKRDASGNPLPGAVFEIRKDGVVLDTIPTGEDGTIRYEGPDGKGLEKGYYIFEEIEAPDGYLLPARTAQGVYVDPGAMTETIILTFVNYEYPDLVIRKVDAGTNITLAGAVFEVRVDGTNLGTFGPTDVSGEIVIDYETYGKFLDPKKDSWTVQVRETQAPDGYLIDDPEWQTAEVRKGETLASFVFTDTAYPEIELYKVDAGTDEPLAGAVFEVMIDGTNLGTFGPTDGTGKITIDYETYGEFLDPEKDSWTVEVRETQAPDGYLIDDPDWQTAELQLGQTLAPFVFTDTKYPEIVIRKSDRETEEMLPGTTFEIDIDAGASFSLTKQTDENGEIRITYEDYEDFIGEIVWDRGWTVTVTETIMPENYNKDKQEESGDWTVTKQLLPGQSLLEFDFTDTHYRDLLVRKYDSTNSW